MILMAQGGTGSPPAGGGELGQVVGGTIGAMIVTAVMFYLVLGHRSGRVKVLDRLGLYAERVAGLPPWAALPLGVLSGSLITAVFGMYWDISTHLDAGRDPGPFANASHYFILAGLFGVFFAGLLAVFLPTESRAPSALRLPGGLEAPLGGVLILVCSGVALSGFPLDDLWHRIFGQDVTLWGPTHLLLFGGASLSTVGGMILRWRARAASREVRPERATRTLRLIMCSLGGAFLIGLSTFQGEFDFAVPQFRLVFHPILLMLASSVALVAVRIWAGRGRRAGRGRLLHHRPRHPDAARVAAVRAYDAALPALPRRGRGGRARRAADRPRPAAHARAAGRDRDRHGRPRRRVGVVVRVVDDRVAVEHARRGRRSAARGRGRRRRHGRVRRARAGLTRDRAAARAALRAARRARGARRRGRRTPRRSTGGDPCARRSR